MLVGFHSVFLLLYFSALGLITTSSSPVSFFVHRHYYSCCCCFGVHFTTFQSRVSSMFVYHTITVHTTTQHFVRIYIYFVILYIRIMVIRLIIIDVARFGSGFFRARLPTSFCCFFCLHLYFSLCPHLLLWAPFFGFPFSPSFLFRSLCPRFTSMSVELQYFQ